MTEDLKRAVLELGVEDAYGLWEVLWKLQPQATTEAGAPARAIAADAVASLLNKGLLVVQLEHNDTSTIVSGMDAQRLLENASSWTEPLAGEGAVRVVATPAGRDAYYSSDVLP